MLISVVIPIYNMEKYLSRCIDSILHQTYTNLEIILVDDGSIDLSGKMCDEYAKEDSRVKVIHKKNGGVSSARNIGIDNSNGEYISFVDPDDWLEPNAYKVLTNTINNNENYCLDIILFNARQNANILNPLPFNGLFSEDRLRDEFVLPFIGSQYYGGLFIMGVVWTYLYRRSFLEKNKIRFTLKDRQEDRFFNVCALFKAKTLFFIKDVLYNYTVNEGSFTNHYRDNRWEYENAYISALKLKIEELPINNTNEKIRFNNDVLLRAVITIHHHFFEGSNNSFKHKYHKVNEIIANSYVCEASNNYNKGKTSLKNSIILFFIKHKCTLLLCAFEEFTVIINKLRK